MCFILNEAGIAYSEWTNYRTDGSRSDPRWKQEYLSSPHTSKVVLMSTQPSVQCVLGLALTTHEHPASRLRMSGAVSQLPLLPG